MLAPAASEETLSETATWLSPLVLDPTAKSQGAVAFQTVTGSASVGTQQLKVEPAAALARSSVLLNITCAPLSKVALTSAETPVPPLLVIVLYEVAVVTPVVVPVALSGSNPRR